MTCEPLESRCSVGVSSEGNEWGWMRRSEPEAVVERAMLYSVGVRSRG